MNTAEVIGLIESQGRLLVEEVIAELQTNLGTSHYRRWKEEGLFERVYTVYRHLAEWLGGQDLSAMQESGEELGRQRFSDGVPLGQVVLALILEEKLLLDYLSRSADPLEEDAQHTICEFFQKTIYTTAHGYEGALAESNRLAQRAVTPPAPAAAKAPAEGTKAEDLGMEISRGGQVGEFGG